MATWEVRQGDCLELLKALPDGSVDAVVADPPYGTEALGGGYGRHRGELNKTILNDLDLGVLGAAASMSRRLLPGTGGWFIAFCGARKRHEATSLIVEAGFEAYGEVVWDKGAPGLGYTIRYAHETAMVFRCGEPPRPSSALLSVIRRPSENSLDHPHQKPLEVMRNIVMFAAPAGGTILDPCAGSGTTGVACMQTGRNFIGMEIDPGYCEIARRRIAEAADTLFTPAPARAEEAKLFGESA